jgi:transcriptional regulator with XRE-family HTH domain
MEKSIYTREYGELLRLLRETRESAKVTQIEFAKSLGQSQSFVSKAERGERRVDVIQLRTFCQALGANFIAFLTELEHRLSHLKTSRDRKR